MYASQECSRKTALLNWKNGLKIRKNMPTWSWVFLAANGMTAIHLVPCQLPWECFSSAWYCLCLREICCEIQQYLNGVLCDKNKKNKCKNFHALQTLLDLSLFLLLWDQWCRWIPCQFSGTTAWLGVRIALAQGWHIFKQNFPIQVWVFGDGNIAVNIRSGRSS